MILYSVLAASSPMLDRNRPVRTGSGDGIHEVRPWGAVLDGLLRPHGPTQRPQERYGNGSKPLLGEEDMAELQNRKQAPQKLRDRNRNQDKFPHVWERHDPVPQLAIGQTGR